jgi:hypothetical protein
MSDTEAFFLADVTSRMLVAREQWIAYDNQFSLSEPRYDRQQQALDDFLRLSLELAKRVQEVLTVEAL